MAQPAHNNPAEALDEYLAIRQEIRTLEMRLEALKPSLFEYVYLQGGKVLHGPFEVCARQRITYTFSEAVVRLSGVLRDLKRDEVRSGVAQVRSNTDFLYVREL